MTFRPADTLAGITDREPPDMVLIDRVGPAVGSADGWVWVWVGVGLAGLR
jgi:hypothetical protein